jgi:hypothetical protein
VHCILIALSFLASLLLGQVLCQHGSILHVFSWCHHHQGSSSCVMIITSHPSLLSHPSYYHHNYCHCYPPLQTLTSMFKFIPFPEEAMLIVALGAPKDAS